MTQHLLLFQLHRPDLRRRHYIPECAFQMEQNKFHFSVCTGKPSTPVWQGTAALDRWGFVMCLRHEFDAKFWCKWDISKLPNSEWG